MNASKGLCGRAMALALAIATLPTPGISYAVDVVRLTDASFLDLDAQLPRAKGHPNEEFRIHGLKAYVSGRNDEAVAYFKRAARYADKVSQHYLAVLHWYGQGVTKDRVQAYIWSDLAAERGSRRMLIIRERMWRELSETERAEVAARGVAFYAEYGDKAAKPRTEHAIRSFANNKTGSRIGYNNQSLGIQFGGPMHGSFGNSTPGMQSASAAVNGGSTGDEMYSEERTNVKAYWKEQDAALEHVINVKIEVGPIEGVTHTPPGA